jgi:hypothetical protein
VPWRTQQFCEDNGANSPSFGPRHRSNGCPGVFLVGMGAISIGGGWPSPGLRSGRSRWQSSGQLSEFGARLSAWASAPRASKIISRAGAKLRAFSVLTAGSDASKRANCQNGHGNREGITAAYSDFLADDGQRSRVRLRQDVNNRCLKKYALIESKV